MRLVRVLLATAAVLISPLAGAADTPKPAVAAADRATADPGTGEREAARPAVPPARRFVSQHEGKFGGQSLRYTATAQETYLTDDKGEPMAAIWSVAYTRDGVEAGKRPVTFVFNGGPGSASVWLHLGLLGPTRVQVASEADADDGAAPYRLLDNGASPLDLTDLVFIDPVGTGYSRTVGAGKPEDYLSLTGDIASMADFIRRWVTANRRWNAPKFIIGESYGTTRAAALSDALLDDGQGLALNGLVLISQALDYEGSTSTPDNLISLATYLPAMALTARYHGKANRDKSLEQVAEEARAFATDTYLPALFKGGRLPAAEREAVATRLAALLGLDKEYVLRSDLRVTVARFRKELLRDRGLAIGQLDGRYAIDDPDRVADSPVLDDAAGEAIDSAYTAALNSLFGGPLRVEMDRPYLTGGAVGKSWDWRPVPAGEGWEPSYVNTARRLAHAMRRNTGMRVMVANGYYDLITPFFDAERTFAAHDIPAERVGMSYYEAGHMMYLRDADRDRLLSDIRAFLAKP